MEAHASSGALFRVPRERASTVKAALIGLSVAPAALLSLVSVALLLHRPVLGLPSARWPDMLALAVLAAVGPYGFYQGRQTARLRRLEARFPDFLRDLASSHQGGLTLVAAVTVA